MSIRCLICWVWAGLLIVNISGQKKTVRAVRINSPVVIDGLLDEEAWSAGIPVSDFLQQEPVSGSEPTFHTEVTVIYNDDFLYVGFMCYDDEPDKILARELKYDGLISSDDNVKIIFDTFNDDRTAYWFGTNPLGAYNEALITGFEYSGFNEDWNGIWEVSSQILENGWSAEFAFPFSTFKFRDEPKQVWGVNFLRGIRRFGEEVQWTAVGENLGFITISHAGDLIGLENISRGDPVYIKPSLTTGFEKGVENEEFVLKPSLDIKYGVTETLSLDVTGNTDFAQVEADRAIINLTRFPLFFPEKREFFLEGAKTLRFNLGGNNEVFYSRRIGLSMGEEIPIIAGAKLVGREGPFEIGALNIQTATKGDEPTTNFTNLRLKYDLFGQSHVGMIITNKVSSGGFNRVYGGDLELSFNDFLGDKNLVIGAALAKSDENESPENSWSGNFFVDYPNDLIDQFAAYRFYQSGFNPEMGFISRRGVENVSYSLRITPRINWSGIKKLRFTPVQSFLTYNSQSQLIAADFSFSPFGFTTVEGDQFEIEIEREFDFVEEDFELFDSTFVRRGKYWFTSYGADLDISYSRPISGSISGAIGDYYDGERRSFDISVNYLFNKHLTISGDYEYNRIKLDGNTFSTNEFGSRIRYDFTNLLFSSLFAQWNNEQEEILFNYRLNWKPKVGSDIYLVVNHLVSTEGKFKTDDIAVLLKVSWLFIF
jgi:hypothetical protein